MAQYVVASYLSKLVSLEKINLIQHRKYSVQTDWKPVRWITNPLLKSSKDLGRNNSSKSREILISWCKIQKFDEGLYIIDLEVQIPPLSQDFAPRNKRGVIFFSAFCKQIDVSQVTLVNSPHRSGKVCIAGTSQVGKQQGGWTTCRYSARADILYR